MEKVVGLCECILTHCVLCAADVLTEDTILRWYKQSHSTKGKSIFLEQMKKFVEWLENAEEGEWCMARNSCFVVHRHPVSVNSTHSKGQVHRHTVCMWDMFHPS